MVDQLTKEVRDRIKEADPEIDVEDITVFTGGYGMVYIMAGNAVLSRIISTGLDLGIEFMDRYGFQGFGFWTRRYPCPDCGSEDFHYRTYQYGHTRIKEGVSAHCQMHLQQCNECGCMWSTGTRNKVTELPGNGYFVDSKARHLPVGAQG